MYSLLDSGRDYARTLQQLLLFPNTVRLRLSVHHSCDLVWLLNGDTLPRIKHLHITLEKLRSVPYRSDQSSYSSLRSTDFDVGLAGCVHLRTLQLRQVPMDVVLTLVTHLKSVRHLGSFTLVNCNVEGTYQCEQRCVYSSFS
jgi:hypothetical protein